MLAEALVEILVILGLIVANGAFSMSEIAVISARRAVLERRAIDGDAGARAAIALSRDPGPFLSTVQVGITLIGVLTGAFAGATLAEVIEAGLDGVPYLGAYAEGVSIAIVVVAVTYVSVVIGELVPKRLALAGPERIAAAVAPAMRLASALARPAVALLDASTALFLRLSRARVPAEPRVTEEEIWSLIRRGAESGAIGAFEHRMVENVMRLGDRPVGAVVTPRRDVVWLDVADPPETVREKVERSRRSRFPVAKGSLDHVVGVVQTKDVLAQLLSGRPLDLGAVARPPLYVPESTPTLRVLERFQREEPRIALVVDELGEVVGIATVNTLLERVIGEVPPGDLPPEPAIVRREDGSWLVDGRIGKDELRDLLKVPRLPGEERGSYHTLAGFVLARLGRLPATGERFDWGGYRFEVVDMDERRIDKVLVSPLAPAAAAPKAEE
jgi:putative hemolysin